MPTELTIESVNEYFSSINPLAQKISEDINVTKSSYEHIWHKLNHNEKIDIINETLINPEISLRYFDNFASPSLSSSTVSLLSSPGSLPTTESINKSKSQNESKLSKLNTKSIYCYDGKNLSTFSNQKTGLKMIHDDVIGMFRDEHSLPFSYKTKSQINLQLFKDASGDKQMTSSMISTVGTNSTQGESSNPIHSIIDTNKYQKVQIELAQSIQSKQKVLSSKTTPVKTSNEKKLKQQSVGNESVGVMKYERFYGDANSGNATSSLEGAGVIINANELNGLVEYRNREVAYNKASDNNGASFLSKFAFKNNIIFNAGSNLMNKSINSNKSSDYDDYEGLNLMKDISYSGLTSSSSLPSGSEEEQEEDKTVCEDSRLLLNNDDLRKGFDFLNNW